MARQKKNATPATSTAATLGYEAQLWQMADALRGSMDAAEYKHVVLGLIFLKYISDAFLTLRSALIERGDDPDERDFYVEQTPIGRTATLQEVASVVRFLMSEESSYVNGQGIVVDGGAIVR